MRTRPSEPEASKTALANQRNAVASWLTEHDATLVAEFTEAETDANTRPQLGSALAACRHEDANLFLAMTDAIGSGDIFDPAWGNRVGGVGCVSITHDRPHPRETSLIVPSLLPITGECQPLPPARAFETVPVKPCLCFQTRTGRTESLVPVFFCNPGPGPVLDVLVESFGALPIQALNTTTVQKGAAVVRPGTCVELDCYDQMFDGDFTTFFKVLYTDAAGIKHEGEVRINKGGPSRRWWVPTPCPMRPIAKIGRLGTFHKNRPDVGGGSAAMRARQQRPRLGSSS